METDEPLDKEFFVTSMPASRPADIYIGYYGGSVFIDFNRLADGLIRLIRISFDGYGCCRLPENTIPMTENESKKFDELIGNDINDQEAMTELIKAIIARNIEHLWDDSLKEYDLI